MDSTVLLERIQAIFRDQFDDPDLTLSRETSADDIEDWDSLSHVTLIGQIEAEFSVRFALGEIQELNNVGEMIDLVARKSAS